ncbi:hypothetical protein BGP_3359 [Beggiatoa sp. PS]|nr:hypothetical protein BGP_3359 [Beggiatoa sp. PS]
MIKTSSILSNLQLELLKLYANNISEQQLFEIKLILANYFAQKASDAMDEIWKTQGLTEQTMIEWTYEHNRIKNRT